jgi:hypothetical protein
MDALYDFLRKCPNTGITIFLYNSRSDRPKFTFTLPCVKPEWMLRNKAYVRGDDKLM